MEVMTLYNETQVSFRERSKGRIQRQLEISELKRDQNSLSHNIASDNQFMKSHNAKLFASMQSEIKIFFRLKTLFMSEKVSHLVIKLWNSQTIEMCMARNQETDLTCFLFAFLDSSLVDKLNNSKANNFQHFSTKENFSVWTNCFHLITSYIV